MHYVYKNIEEYNLGKKRKVLIVFDDIIADMISNKKLNPIVTELFIIRRKLYVSIVFIWHLFTNRQTLHYYFKLLTNFSQLANYGHIEKTRFFFKLLLILPIPKLATKRETLFVTNTYYKSQSSPFIYHKSIS